MTQFADVLESATAERTVKGWRVLHACETLPGVSELADAQTAVGMNPQLLPRDFWSTIPQEPLSLMNAWHDVRDWRHALNDAEALWSPQLVHAHSFGSAMAGVRGSLPLVYDFQETLDEIGSHQANNGAWLLRSLRVAEQFALSRASAVVTHGTVMKKIAHERGAATTNIFSISEPYPVADSNVNTDWAADHGIDLGYDVVLYASRDASGAESVLRAFATVKSELDRALLLLEFDEPGRETVIRLARDLEIADSLRHVDSQDRSFGIACANVVIAPATDDAYGRANPAMLMAMAAGKPVVAADVAENRECSEEGRGCIWFRAGDFVDLAQRTSFVARNADFGHALGEGARAHVELTRAPQVIARQYDQVYRHAVSRRTERIPKIPMPKLYALGAI